MEIKELFIHAKSQMNHSDLKKEASLFFEKNGFPNKKVENYKYSDIEKLLKGKNFLPSNEQSFHLENLDYDLDHVSGLIILDNGILNEEISFIIDPNIELFINDEEISNEISKFFKLDSDSINAHHIANRKQEIGLKVKKGKVIQNPLLIVHSFSNNSLSAGCVYLEIQENAQITVLEIQKSEANFLSNNLTVGKIERNAIMEFNIIQKNFEDNCLINNYIFEVKKGANATTNTYSLNGKFIRNNLKFHFNEEFGEAHLNALYMPSADCLIDNQTMVDHAQPNCFSNEFYKGIMSGNGVGVFNGKVLVGIDAQKTNAYQSNKNLLLSNEAGIFTKPQLEIFADDVKCSHGATIGEIDSVALFYLKSRGINDSMARKLLVEAYGNEIAEKIKHPEIKKYISGKIWKKIEENFNS